ncbi:hypothetical protein Q4E93_27015 [Flavitalea sp. BT771]|uniref:hypothetical protein n=1 Tax=Flavitalea sp. BT771 TaxID=3063329 RepID=UPI0026E37F7B|nr:hypothetical protein [Flavitalea sp. BT771]MDO6434291.1 hypothetical protein [Flavitalea sp. BT771]MDV6223191.1 hypothetical protein [Flavitalea sp. BT771]
MQQFSATAFSIAALLSLAACKGHQKKVIVYAGSDIQVDNTKTNITVGEGGPLHQQDLDFSGGDPVTLNAQTPSGKVSLEVAEDGLYIANLKNDTIVGSFQRVGAASGSNRITQDQLKPMVDSLEKLVRGENVSAANKNYFILPNHIAKVSQTTAAKVFGPYTTIPSSFDAGSVPEIYKFYSVKEVHEMINKFNGIISPAKPAK